MLQMNSQLFLSIALATYNGEAYIGKLLDSIIHQTRLPDEIIISDDASTDSTLKVVEDFMRLSPIPIRLHRNQERVGSTPNFEVAIRACNGDIIFLCDQDDVWYPEKIARIEECFVNDKKAGIVFTDANVVNKDLCPYGTKLWERIKFSPREQKNIEIDPLMVLLKHYVVTGATMAFRSSFLDFILPIPKVWTHDAWIALMVGFSSHFIALPVPLIAYRQHSNNQIGAPRPGKNRGKSLSSIYSPRVLLYELVRDRLLEIADRIPNPERKIIYLNEKIAFLSTCAALPDSHLRRLPILIRELSLLHYHRYAKKGVGTFFGDLIRGSWML
jgi:glycosyltransferase involved in cell wall biosynthesis